MLWTIRSIIRLPGFKHLACKTEQPTATARCFGRKAAVLYVEGKSFGEITARRLPVVRNSLMSILEVGVLILFSKPKLQKLNPQHGRWHRIARQVSEHRVRIARLYLQFILPNEFFLLLFHLKLELTAKTLNANCSFRAPSESPRTACAAVAARFVLIVVSGFGYKRWC